ncbi:hypothetical protein Tco_0277408 [Tanacetum coccineum]
MLRNKVEYGVSTSIGYGVSSFLSNTTYSSQQINTTYPLLLDTAYRSSDKMFSVRMSKVIKGEFEKIKDVKVEDVSLTCDTTTVNYSNRGNDDSEHEADDDMRYDPSDVAFIEWNLQMMKMKLLNSLESTLIYLTMIHLLCSAFNEFNYLLKVDPDLLTKDIIGFKTYDDYKDDWIYEWNKDVPWVYDKPWLDNGIWKEPTPDYEWYEALEDCELKNEALRNKAIMEGFIKDDDDESRSEQMKGWNIYANYDDAYEINHEREELCKVQDEYDDLTITRKEACLAYQEIFRIVDKGWMVTRDGIKEKLKKSLT